MSFNHDGLRHPTHLHEAVLWRYAVKVRCKRCNHVAIFEAWGLWGWFLSKRCDDSRWQAAGRLRCVECRSRGRKHPPPFVEFIQGEEPTISLPMPIGVDPERELKRYRY